MPKRRGDPMKRPVRPKRLSPNQKVRLLTFVLFEVQARLLHEPDSDLHEYCPGCHRSPHAVVPHADDCLVVKVAHALNEALRGVRCIHCGEQVTSHRDWCQDHPRRTFRNCASSSSNVVGSDHDGSHGVRQPPVPDVRRRQPSR